MTERQQDTSDDIESATTVPVNTRIEADHLVYDLSEAETILREAYRISVEDCGCRREARRCQAPLDVCLSLDEQAERALQKGANARSVSVDEALAILRRSHEAGLVHMAYQLKDEDKQNVLCSCCPCCCNTLGPMLRQGIHSFVISSKYIAEDDTEKCIRCGACTERCVFGARKIVDRIEYDSSRCMGCGLCVTTCPTGAIHMTSR